MSVQHPLQLFLPDHAGNQNQIGTEQRARPNRRESLIALACLLVEQRSGAASS